MRQLPWRAAVHVDDVKLVLAAGVGEEGDPVAVGTSARLTLEDAARRRQIARRFSAAGEPEISARFEQQFTAVGRKLSRGDEAARIDLARQLRRWHGDVQR